MSHLPPSAPETPPPPTFSDVTIALIVYALYFAAYFTGITAIIGVVVAHVQSDTADPMLRSHYRFQIRTFWVGLIYLIVGGILTVLLIGFAILFWWFIWSLVRNVKGVLALNANRPIADPKSWMFG